MADHLVMNNPGQVISRDAENRYAVKPRETCAIRDPGPLEGARIAPVYNFCKSLTAMPQPRHSPARLCFPSTNRWTSGPFRAATNRSRKSLKGHTERNPST